jgi:hypothetical protein
VSVGIQVFRELRTAYVSGPTSYLETNKCVSKIRQTVYFRFGIPDSKHYSKAVPQSNIFFEWVLAIFHKSSAVTFFNFKYTIRDLGQIRLGHGGGLPTDSALISAGTRGFSLFQEPNLLWGLLSCLLNWYRGSLISNFFIAYLVYKNCSK